MGSVPPLLSFLLMIAAGWVHRHQLIVIEFLQAENRLLKERLRGRRIRFTDAERALLARKAKAVGRKALLELDSNTNEALQIRLLLRVRAALMLSRDADVAAGQRQVRIAVMLIGCPERSERGILVL
jgi:hypothetical protein